MVNHYQDPPGIRVFLVFHVAKRDPEYQLLVLQSISAEEGSSFRVFVLVEVS
jgi:hypothetical protein